MSLFKNEVGRPSNETIKKRNIFKGICVLLVIVVIGLILYILSDKGIITINNVEKNNKDNQEVTTTTQQDEKTEKENFDVNKITVEDLGVQAPMFPNNQIRVYVYNNPLNYEYITDSIKNIEPIDDLALIELNGDGGYLLLVDKLGNVLYDFELKNGMFYMGVNKEYCPDCYGYKIENNKITATITDLGQDVEYNVCGKSYSKTVFKEIEVTYKDGKVTTKVLKMLTGKEYSKNNNIKCSNAK